MVTDLALRAMFLRMMSVGFIFDSLGAGEILVILGAALLLFGAERLPALARMLGRAMNEIRRATGDLTHIITDGDVAPSASKKPEQQDQSANEEPKKREG